MVKEVFKDYENMVKIKNLDEFKKWISKNWFVFVIGIFIGMIIKWVLIVLLMIGVGYLIYRLMKRRDTKDGKKI